MGPSRRTLALLVGLLCGCVGQDIVAGLEPGPGGQKPTPCRDGRCECALPECDQICDRPGERLCPFTCADGSTCHNICPGGDCSLDCGADATCSLACEGGDCGAHCDGSTSCDLFCGGGGCDLTCVDTEMCVLDCPGGACRLVCSGVDHCELRGCGDNCTVECGGAATCLSSCDGGPGCSTTP